MRSLNLFATEKEKNVASNVLLNGKDSDFWRLIKKIVAINVEHLKELIISEIDENGNPITEKQLIEARMKVLAFRDVVGTPEHFIRLFTGQELVEEPLDPYVTINDVKDPVPEAEVKEDYSLPADFDTEPY